MKANIKSLVLVLTGSIYGFMLFVSSICGATSYPTSTATSLANDLSMNQYNLNDVGDIITKGPWVDARAYNGGAFNNTTISAAITAIGANNRTLLLAPGTWTISANVTVPSNINLRFEQGAVLSIGAGYTFTINGTIEAKEYQLFTGSGSVTLNNPGSVESAWFGSGVSSIQKAHDAVNGACIINLPRATIDFGTTSLIINKFGIVLAGKGIGAERFSTWGTKIVYTGTDAAIKLTVDSPNGDEMGHGVVIKDLLLFGNSTGYYGIKGGNAEVGATKTSAVFKMENVNINGFTQAGMLLKGANYCIFDNCRFNYNDGAGVVAPSQLIDSNNVMSFLNCTFSYNDKEGVLINKGEDWQFMGCAFETNGYEGFKAESYASRQIENIKLQNCWFEGNQVDANRLDGYYSILITDNHVGRITIENCSLRNVDHEYNSSTGVGNKLMSLTAMEITLINNSYGYFAATFTKPYNYVYATPVQFINEDIDKWKISSSSRVEGSFSAYNKSQWNGKATSGIGEDDLFSHTISANKLCAPEIEDTSDPTKQMYQRGGRFNTFRIVAHGTKTDTAAGANKTIKLYWGTNVICSFVSTNNKDWCIEAYVNQIDTTEAVQSIFVRAWEGDASSGSLLVSDNLSGNQSITAPITIKVTGECANVGDEVKQWLLSVQPM